MNQVTYVSAYRTHTDVGSNHAMACTLPAAATKVNPQPAMLWSHWYASAGSQYSPSSIV